MSSTLSDGLSLAALLPVVSQLRVSSHMAGVDWQRSVTAHETVSDGDWVSNADFLLYILDGYSLDSLRSSYLRI